MIILKIIPQAYTNCSTRDCYPRQTHSKVICFGVGYVAHNPGEFKTRPKQSYFADVFDGGLHSPQQRQRGRISTAADAVAGAATGKYASTCWRPSLLRNRVWRHLGPHGSRHAPAQRRERYLRTDPVYFVGVGLGYTLIPSFSVPMPFCACSINGLRLEVEGQLGRYFGLQDHFESVLVLLLRSPQFPLLAGFSANVAIGEGVSYAYSLPKFEGSVAEKGLAAGIREFLNYLAYEMEFSHEQVKNWHLLLNVHHRSGIWGVIAPRKTGANYIGVGVRADF